MVLKSIFDQFPYALDVFGFYYADKPQVRYVSTQDEVFLSLPAAVKMTATEIQRFRQSIKELTWGDADDLPFGTKKKKFDQISIEDEILQNVLFIAIPSLTDDSNDIFIITFPKSFSNFYLQSGRNSLSSEAKKGIGRIIRNQLLWLYELRKDEAAQMDRIRHVLQQQADRVKQVSEELEAERKNNAKYLQAFLRSKISQLEEEFNTSIQLSPEFVPFIQRSGVALGQVEEVLRTAFETAWNLTFNHDLIILETFHIPLSSANTTSTTGRTTQLIRLDKTAQLLDRYEKAARQLQSRNRAVNGSNLAKELGISGAAITDAVKKNAGKILKILEKSANSWPLICEFIKPIREIYWESQRESA